MTIPAEAIAEIAALVVRVVPEIAAGIMSALREDVREAVLAEVERNQKALDGMLSVTSRVDAAREATLSRLRADRQARSETARDRFTLTDTMRAALRTVVDGREANHTEREDLRVLARFLDASLRGEVALVLPRVLDVPAPIASPLAAPIGAWSEPSTSED
jgi:hypothetical protein